MTLTNVRNITIIGNKYDLYLFNNVYWVPVMCQSYYSKPWEKAVNQAGQVPALMAATFPIGDEGCWEQHTTNEYDTADLKDVKLKHFSPSSV